MHSYAQGKDATSNLGRPLPTPPGSRGLPLLGETLEFIRAPGKFAEEHRDKYGPIFMSKLFGKPTVFIRGAEANRWVYAGEGKYLENERTPAIRKLLGASSSSLHWGEEHERRAELLLPRFEPGSMDACIPGMLAVIRKHLRRWTTDAELGPLTIMPRMHSLAFEVAATCVFGDLGDLGVKLDEFYRDFNTWTAGMSTPLPVALPGSKLARAMDARKRMFTILDDLVMRRDAAARRGPELLSALLELYDEDGEPLPRDTIVNELQRLLFTGHDATVNGMSNVMYQLATHPAVMAKARAEQDALATPRFTLGSLDSMTYLDAVIKESLRVMPPAGGSFWVMLEDAEFGGFQIPKGWRVAIGPRSVHWEHDAAPDRFDPERWLGDNDRPLGAISFGDPRNRLSMHFALLEMHIVLALLLREFSWELIADQDLSFTQLPLPLRGLMVELEPIAGG